MFLLISYEVIFFVAKLNSTSVETLHVHLCTFAGLFPLN